MKNNEKFLFQISEAARACGVSRSTLLRMEEKGLLKPAYVSEESGRRYYDNFNIAQIMQVEKFKAMGLNSEEIIRYYESGGQIEPLRAALEYKLCELQNGVEELRLRSAEPGTYSISETIIPEMVCVMRKSMGHTIKDKYEASFNAYAECIRKGYRLSGDPLFTISDRTDYLSGHIGEKDYAMYSCVPLKEKVPEAVVYTIDHYCIRIGNTVFLTFFIKFCFFLNLEINVFWRHRTMIHRKLISESYQHIRILVCTSHQI